MSRSELAKLQTAALIRRASKHQHTPTLIWADSLTKILALNPDHGPGAAAARSLQSFPVDSALPLDPSPSQVWEAVGDPIASWLGHRLNATLLVLRGTCDGADCCTDGDLVIGLLQSIYKLKGAAGLGEVSVGLSAWELVGEDAVDLLQGRRYQPNLKFATVSAPTLAAASSIVDLAGHFTSRKDRACRPPHSFLRVVLHSSVGGRLTTLHVVRLNVSPGSTYSPRLLEGFIRADALLQDPAEERLRDILMPLLDGNNRTWVVGEVGTAEDSFPEDLGTLRCLQSMHGRESRCHPTTGVSLEQLEMLQPGAVAGLEGVSQAKQQQVDEKSPGDKGEVKTEAEADFDVFNALASVVGRARATSAEAQLENLRLAVSERQQEVVPEKDALTHTEEVCATATSTSTATATASAGGGSEKKIIRDIKSEIEAVMSSFLADRDEPDESEQQEALAHPAKQPGQVTIEPTAGAALDSPPEQKQQQPSLPPAPALSSEVTADVPSPMSPMPMPSMSTPVPVPMPMLHKVSAKTLGPSPSSLGLVAGCSPTSAHTATTLTDGEVMQQNNNALLAVVRDEVALRERAQQQMRELEQDLLEALAACELSRDGARLEAAELKAKLRLLEAERADAHVFDVYEGDIQRLVSEVEALRGRNLAAEMRLLAMSLPPNSSSPAALSHLETSSVVFRPHHPEASLSAVKEVRRRLRESEMELTRVKQENEAFRRQQRRFMAQERLLEEHSSQSALLGRRLLDADQELRVTRLESARIEAEAMRAREEVGLLRASEGALLEEREGLLHELGVLRGRVGDMERDHRQFARIRSFIEKHSGMPFEDTDRMVEGLGLGQVAGTRPVSERQGRVGSKSRQRRRP